MCALGLTLAGCSPPIRLGGSVQASGNVTVQLANGDAGRTVDLKPGDTLEITLRQEAGLTPWTALGSDDRLVMMPEVDVKATAPRGVTAGRFKALAPGRARISAVATPACSSGSACPQFVRSWSVLVQVQGP